jgi:hypothetical protein
MNTKKLAVLMFWACVGFSTPSGIDLFLSGLPKGAETKAKLTAVQNTQDPEDRPLYEIFYPTDQAPDFTCPPNADCADWPQECK